MANDRWVAPIAELLAPKTGVGPTGFAEVNWSNPGVSLSQRVGTRLTAWGTITTTGTPHLILSLGALVNGPVTFDTSTQIEDLAPTGVTAQQWRIDYTEYCTDASDTAPKVAYVLTVSGLFAATVQRSGVFTGTQALAFGSLQLTWDTVAADADGGDSVTMQGCIVESIG
jgi:hypothetical protein